jgi:hypothetical protein
MSQLAMVDYLAKRQRSKPNMKLQFLGDAIRQLADYRGAETIKSMLFSTFFHFFEKKSDFFISLAPEVFNFSL